MIDKFQIAQVFLQNSVYYTGNYEVTPGQAEVIAATIIKIDKASDERDKFARDLPSDEIQDMTYRCLSRQAQERLTDMKYPQNEDYKDAIEYQIEKVKFQCEINAILRYMHADAMLRVREKRS